MPSTDTTGTSSALSRAISPFNPGRSSGESTTTTSTAGGTIVPSSREIGAQRLLRDIDDAAWTAGVGEVAPSHRYIFEGE
ncbi:uncharacterized protein I206_100466 [Kwoniella pini CBS 10737]|uniref:Uncharacterized protein n=1 Tax=Kwoniella pini CBS 10737 TaxID=1296096 RepID=A0A1B9ID21_9TREE|nr:uncharacterized protein I206_00863 [Kwoniella pini CBS 10737]OCF53558.1 hypothetical protein I206_00863 [Kwoniella pini CBS 10737]